MPADFWQRRSEKALHWETWAGVRANSNERPFVRQTHRYRLAFIPIKTSSRRGNLCSRKDDSITLFIRRNHRAPNKSDLNALIMYTKIFVDTGRNPNVPASLISSLSVWSGDGKKDIRPISATSYTLSPLRHTDLSKFGGESYQKHSVFLCHCVPPVFMVRRDKDLILMRSCVPWSGLKAIVDVYLCQAGEGYFTVSKRDSKEYIADYDRYTDDEFNAGAGALVKTCLRIKIRLIKPGGVYK